MEEPQSHFYDLVTGSNALSVLNEGLCIRWRLIHDNGELWPSLGAHILLPMSGWPSLFGWRGALWCITGDNPGSERLGNSSPQRVSNYCLGRRLLSSTGVAPETQFFWYRT